MKRLALVKLLSIFSITSFIIVGCQRDESNMIQLNCKDSYWNDKYGRILLDESQKNEINIKINQKEKKVDVLLSLDQNNSWSKSTYKDGEIKSFSNGVFNTYFVNIDRDEIRYGFVFSHKILNTTYSFRINRLTGEFIDETIELNRETKKRRYVFREGHCTKPESLKSKL